ncbi:Hypothetical protein CINCED_3A025572 [Cinara cedri]|nr:Hypothetical protein CINCED_3A025572 [Cinara cedri]
MDTAKNQLDTIKIVHARLTEKIAMYKQQELPNNYAQEIEHLKSEQEYLKAQIKAQLLKFDIGKYLPDNDDAKVDVKSSDSPVIKDQTKPKQIILNKTVDAKDNTNVKDNANVPKTEKKQKQKKNNTTPQNITTTPVDFGRLDLRVGKILSASRHPNADALYVETIDVGEETPRTVVSGLVKFVPLEAMTNRMVVLLCNLKPSKIRGILSEAMVMCASSPPENVEILEPPKGSVPGDYVNVSGYTRSPDKVLKVFEEIAQDLKTDENLQATYKSIPWTVSDKGVVVAASLKNVNIK